MTPRATRVRAALAAVLLPALGAGCDENILDPMADRQPRAKAYQESVFFADGLSMRPPPKGTVPRERITMNPPLTTGHGPESGAMAPNGERIPVYVTAIPLPVTRDLLEIGRKRYDITCGTCHGPVGDGDSIVARQMALRPPPSLMIYADRPPGYIFEVISKGFGLMASYAAELTVQERWAVVAYVRALQLSQNVPVDRAPPEVRAQLESQPAEPQKHEAPHGAPPAAPAHKEAP